MKPRFLLIASLVTVGVALGTMAWMRELALSIDSFASPLRTALPAGARTTPLSGQVVLIVSEDLDAGSLAVMPSVASIRRQGSTSLLQVDPNARPQDLLSGALHDVLRGRSPYAPETITSVVRRAGGTTVMSAPAEWVAGQAAWLSEGFSPPASSADPTGEIVSRTLKRLDLWLPELAVVVLPAPPVPPGAAEAAATGAVTGTASAPRVAPARIAALDGYVGEIWHAMQQGRPGNTSLILAGAADGAPVVMAGRGLAAASGTILAPGDIALTAAALLGAPLPSASLGRVQFPLMQMAPAVEAEKQIALGLQRQALADALLTGIGRLPTGESVESDLVVARSALTARNYESAQRLAGHAVNQADAAIQAGSTGRLEAERLFRLPILVLAGFPLVYAVIGLLAALVAQSPAVNAMGLAPRRLLRPWSAATTIGVLLAGAACLAFWQRRQYEPDWPLLPWTIGVGALGVLLATAASSWWRNRDVGPVEEGHTRKPATPVSVALGAYALSLVFVSLLAPAWFYYVQGPAVTWYLPDPQPLAAFQQNLGRAFMVALLLAPVPWAGSILYFIVGWLWRGLAPLVVLGFRKGRTAVAGRWRARMNPGA